VATPKCKQSLYFPDDVLTQIQAEAIRQDRSLSWIVQQTWRLAREEVSRLPTPNAILGLEPERSSEPVVAVEEPVAATPVVGADTLVVEIDPKPEPPKKKIELPDPYLEWLKELEKKRNG
jgi:uncharacterized small protein (TIGR04563 family)